MLYRARDITDALFVGFPVNEDAESFFGWYRLGEDPAFSPEDRDVLTSAFRSLKWFHRRVCCPAWCRGGAAHRRRAPPGELLLTARSEKEIASELSLTPATTHTYITELFRKFGVSGRAGLTALWLGRPADTAPTPSD